MYKRAVKKHIKNLFQRADVHIDGNRPWDIQVKDDRFFHKVSLEGSLGMGEAYMDGWIDAPRLDETIERIMSANLEASRIGSWKMLFKIFTPFLLNQQSKSRSLDVGRRHYDLSNFLFQCMLDMRMTYSCGYWKNAKNLDEAQEAKLDLVCKKIRLKPGMKVLDIGCGWGSFAKFAAEKYQAHVVGITISQKQMELAREHCKGLPIEIRFQDYRDIDEKFDRIVSIGQMEHVGYKNFKNYMKIVAQSLDNQGLFLLHTIGNNITTHTSDPWIDKYIFPNGMIPSQVQLAKASEGVFVMEDWHNFGSDYDKTLMAWHKNFNHHWDTLKAFYDERFYRMWNYYLLTCAGAFRSRSLQLWQIVYSKNGIPGGYQSIR